MLLLVLLIGHDLRHCRRDRPPTSSAASPAGRRRLPLGGREGAGASPALLRLRLLLTVTVAAVLQQPDGGLLQAPVLQERRVALVGGPASGLRQRPHLGVRWRPPHHLQLHTRISILLLGRRLPLPSTLRGGIAPLGGCLRVESASRSVEAVDHWVLATDHHPALVQGRAPRPQLEGDLPVPGRVHVRAEVPHLVETPAARASRLRWLSEVGLAAARQGVAQRVLEGAVREELEALALRAEAIGLLLEAAPHVDQGRGHRCSKVRDLLQVAALRRHRSVPPAAAPPLTPRARSLACAQHVLASPVEAGRGVKPRRLA
mmetsp:Transcript_15243/g.53586  ORF Transcript_15243/g.53586 Transcript_15243/m.53586 type:complete len:317 (+) Transcript_15243:733-1683(+)